MKKILAMLMALILCVSLCASASAEGDWTILVYICGADLESEYALASDNMQEMIDANTNANVRFVVQTGGASEWENGASSDALDRFLITGGRRELVDRQPQASMGRADTLSAFLRWGLSAYPAAHTGLVLWDHGSGSINGVCFDELADDESLSLKDIESSLQSVQSILPKGFDFIGFDACLMGTVETAAMLAPYAQYMIASQEIEPGSGWDYEAIGWFMNTYPYADGAQLGRAICDGYYQNCIDNDAEEGATLALTDLSKIGAFRTAFDTFARDLLAATEDNADYAPIARGIASADNFGGNNRSEGYTNMVDLGGLIEAGGNWSFQAREVRAALDALTVYQVRGANHSRASGLSVYYPLEVQGSMELGIFKDVCISPYYLELVNKVAYGFANGGNWEDYDGSMDWAEDWDWDEDDGQSTAISFQEKPHLNEDGIYVFTLTEDALNNTESVEAAVYLLVPEEDDVVCYGYTSDVVADWETGIVEDNFDGYWFALPDGQALCVYLVDQRDDYDIFTSPVEVNGEEKYLRFAWDYTGEVRVLDLWDGISSNGIASRPGDSLKQGDRIVPLYDAFSLSSDDEYYYYGDAYVWKNNDKLCFDLLPDGDYLYAFSINDIYGGNYMTDTVEFSVDGENILYTAA